jgi:hypothetical protein
MGLLMSEHAAHIADLERRLAALKAERAADEHTRLSEELQPEPEPGPSMYGTSLHPDIAHERITDTGHGVGGHAGLGAGVSN